MVEIYLEERTHIEETSEKTVKVTTLYQLARKKVMTNSDIEQRKLLSKFGCVASKAKGVRDNFISDEDKEIFLQNSQQPANDESLGKFNLNHVKKDKLDRLNAKQQDLKSGKDEETKVRTVREAPDFYSIRVTNVPSNVDEDDFRDFISAKVNFMRIYFPKPRNQPVHRQRKNQRGYPRFDAPPNDFIYLHFMSEKEAMRAREVLEGEAYELSILSVEKPTVRKGVISQQKRNYN